MEKHVNLDELDLQILIFLQKDGRMSFTDIAEKLNVSIGTVRTRVNHLIEENFVQIIGRINPEKIGFKSYARINIAIRPASKIEEITQTVKNMPQVSFVATTSGDFDLEISAMCADNQTLKDFIDRISALDGVHNTQTTFYLRVHKFSQPEVRSLMQ